MSASRGAIGLSCVLSLLQLACGSVESGGSETLIATSDEPAGSNCTGGGTRVDVGLDGDGDGTLDASEVSETTYVCDEPTGVLSITADEPAGANCADGGTRVSSGLDNGDGGGTADNDTLESGEIDTVQYVCDGAPIDVLVMQTPEDPGVNCGGGGTRVDVGLDNGDGDGTAGDDVLQPGEIDDTAYTCVNPWFGAGVTWRVNGIEYGRFTWAEASIVSDGRGNAAAFCTARGGTLARPDSQPEWDLIHQVSPQDSTGWWIDGHNNFTCGSAVAGTPKTYQYGRMFAPTGTAGLYTGCNCTTTEEGLVVYRYSGSFSFDGCQGTSTAAGALGAMDEQLTYVNPSIAGFICAKAP